MPITSASVSAFLHSPKVCATGRDAREARYALAAAARGMRLHCHAWSTLRARASGLANGLHGRHAMAQSSACGAHMVIEACSRYGQHSLAHREFGRKKMAESGPAGIGKPNTLQKRRVASQAVSTATGQLRTRLGAPAALLSRAHAGTLPPALHVMPGTYAYMKPGPRPEQALASTPACGPPPVRPFG